MLTDKMWAILLAGTAVVVELKLILVAKILSSEWTFEQINRIGSGNSPQLRLVDPTIYLVLLVPLAAGLLFFRRNRVIAYALLFSIPATVAFIGLSALRG